MWSPPCARQSEEHKRSSGASQSGDNSESYLGIVDMAHARGTDWAGSRTPEHGDGPSPQLVQSVARALRLVEVVSDGPPAGLTLSEIARSLGVSKSALLVTVRTLAAFGYVRSVEPGPRYKLGMNLVRLGDVATRGLRLTEICGG